MLRRRKVQPFVHEYISRRYDDTAVVVYEALRSDRGLRNCYVTWLEGHLEGFPEEQRKKYSLLRTTASSAKANSLEEDNTKEGSGDPSDGAEQQAIAERTTANSSRFCTIL